METSENFWGSKQIALLSGEPVYISICVKVTNKILENREEIGRSCVTFIRLFLEINTLVRKLSQKNTAKSIRPHLKNQN
jgi:uncharacterized membrane-anchored protein YjiN (DUF445 family)